MIVSHKHQFVFLAVPRTATHAIRTVLTPLLAANDWQQQQLFGQETLPIPQLAALGHGHITLQQLTMALTADTLNKDVARFGKLSHYTRLAIVRNPFDRFVSVCAFLNKKNTEFEQHPTRWMLQAFDRPQFRQRILVRPQTDMLVDEHNDLDVSVLGRYEQLQASMDEFARVIDVELPSLPIKNVSSRGEWPAYYNDELVARVVEFYARDFELLGYSPKLSDSIN